MMKAVLAFLCVPLAAASEVGSVKQWLDKYCDMLGKFAGKEIKTTDNWQESLQGDMDPFFNDKLHCSLRQYNGIVGFDLKEVSFAECMKYQAERFAKAIATQQEIASMECVDTVAHEHEKNGMMWLKLKTTGEWSSKMTATMAVKVTVFGNKAYQHHMEIEGHHFPDHGKKESLPANIKGQQFLDQDKKKTVAANIESLHFLQHDNTMSPPEAGDVQTWLAKYCFVVTRLAGRKTTDDWQEGLPEFNDLYSTRLDCSLNRHNDIVGYDVKSAPFDHCMKVQADRFAHNIAAKEIVSMRCIETVADELEKKGMMWLELTTTRKSGETTSATMAGKVAIVDGTASAYHIVVDSHFLLDHDNLRMV